MPLETPLLDLHQSSGATIGEYFGTLLPARFGEFTAEYAALREGGGPRGHELSSVLFVHRSRPASLPECASDLECPRSEARPRNRWTAAEPTGTHPGGGGNICAGGKHPGDFATRWFANGRLPRSTNSSSWTTSTLEDVTSSTGNAGPGGASRRGTACGAWREKLCGYAAALRTKK